MTDAVAISLKEAAERGIERVRKPQWVTPEDHVKIDIINGNLGPWLHLWCPFNTECNGRDPVDVLAHQSDIGLREWVAYNGPHSDSEEYKTAVAMYSGALSGERP